MTKIQLFHGLLTPKKCWHYLLQQSLDNYCCCSWYCLAYKCNSKISDLGKFVTLYVFDMLSKARGTVWSSPCSKDEVTYTLCHKHKMHTLQKIVITKFVILTQSSWFRHTSFSGGAGYCYIWVCCKIKLRWKHIQKRQLKSSNQYNSKKKKNMAVNFRAFEWV